jgi:hypothetical protein
MISSRNRESWRSGRRWPRFGKLSRDSAASTAVGRDCARRPRSPWRQRRPLLRGRRPRDRSRLSGEPPGKALLHLLVTGDTAGGSGLHAALDFLANVQLVLHVFERAVVWQLLHQVQNDLLHLTHDLALPDTTMQASSPSRPHPRGSLRCASIGDPLAVGCPLLGFRQPGLVAVNGVVVASVFGFRLDRQSPRAYPALRRRKPAVAAGRLAGNILIETEPPSARAHFTSVLTPRFFTRPDSSFATYG